MNKKIYQAILIFTCIISSCVPRKQIVYFQNDKINQNEVSNSYKTYLKPDDLLKITVSSSDYEASKPFNLPAVTFSTTTDRVAGTPQQQTYLVDQEGYIDFPVIGKIKIAGMTRNEAIEFLKNKLDPDYIKNPTINIRIANYSITILGDVNKPGTYTIPNERITILEALGLAGDLKIRGRREVVKVFREIDGKKEEFVICLLYTSDAADD